MISRDTFLWPLRAIGIRVSQADPSANKEEINDDRGRETERKRCRKWFLSIPR
jgi:hypothetical protein